MDIIGDIHGQNDVLITALQALGYENLSGVWRHPAGRKTLFLGDLIDRGPHNRAVVEAVKAMVENGEAVCLMGNHELNAVHFATDHPQIHGQYLRARSDKNLRQHLAFLWEYHSARDGEQAIAEHLAWFRTLPLWVELEGVRAVHACWSPVHLNRLMPALDEARAPAGDFWLRTAAADDPLMDAVEVVLKGAEIRLPQGVQLVDKDGHKRDHARLKWWQGPPARWADSVMAKPALIKQLEACTDQPQAQHSIPQPDKPTFFGHYWFEPQDGQPWLASPTACGLDFSVAKPGGLLGVYRWDGEDALERSKLFGFGPA
ncbi:metallophosphoesterase [Maricaulis sp.]|uniref:metallophosphoesterase n=1 Tax=Maricaulis sp. TaxID=1486257 RepID=UPI0026294E98|nr:metallophosphoesterase [Maricaulis sp.]MDF1769455.1 metallophosphoesterase [Maricaulis sp.]